MSKDTKEKLRAYPVHTECIHCGGPVGMGHGSTGICSWCIIRPGRYKMKQKVYYAREKERGPRPDR